MENAGRKREIISLGIGQNIVNVLFPPHAYVIFLTEWIGMGDIGKPLFFQSLKFWQHLKTCIYNNAWNMLIAIYILYLNVYLAS